MEKLKFDDMKKTWHEIARYQDKAMDIEYELEIHKKLLDIFHIGDYYYYICNLFKVEFEFLSDNVKKVLKLNETSDFSVEYIFDNIHPGDKNRFIAFEQKVTSFFNGLSPDLVMKYKVSYDYRIKCSDGTYKWILQQVTTIQSDENGAVIRVLGVHTDVTHLKPDSIPSGLSFIGLDGAPSYINVAVDEVIDIPPEPMLLTIREKEILKLIVNGNTSNEIAAILFISKHTVDSHRKNILRKTNCRTNSELLFRAVTQNIL